MALEKFYSVNLESHYNRIYDILVDSNKKEVSEDERELIISTVVTMFYRTASCVNMHIAVMGQAFESIFDACAKTSRDEYVFEGR